MPVRRWESEDGLLTFLLNISPWGLLLLHVPLDLY